MIIISQFLHVSTPRDPSCVRPSYQFVADVSDIDIDDVSRITNRLFTYCLTTRQFSALAEVLTKI